jgi:hypothetical protein
MEADIMRGEIIGVCIDFIGLGSNVNTVEENIKNSDPGFIGQPEHTFAIKDDKLLIDKSVSDRIPFPSKYYA